MSKKILIIEDEQDIAELIKAQLSTLNLESKIILDGNLASLEIDQNHNQYSLYIIDRMLPGKSGLKICQMMRSQNITSPILMVTALTQSENIVEGLDAGADDYITKPFDMDVLLARVRAQLRRVQKAPQNNEVITIEDLKIDLKKCSVDVLEKTINLTHTEFSILCILASDPGRVFTREQLIKSIIGDNVHVTNRTIDTHVAGLRKKLGNTAKFIKTIRGIGYRFLTIDEVSSLS